MDSRFHVTVDYHQTKAADTLAALLGDRAVVALGEAGRTGRLNDGEPHYGGAGIRKGYSSNTASNTCTSGFMVRNSSGGVAGMTAAGHCFANGDYVYSSTQYYGYASGKGVDYPTVDIMRVYSSGETYDNIIHVDPCSPCTRTVTAKSRVANGSSGLCSSGMVTRAICSLTVVSVEASVCDPYCSIGLIKVTRNGDTIVRPGDSGGPVYLRNGSTTASAVGTIVGGSSGSRYVTSTAMYIEPYAAIEGALGMYIATY